MFCYDESRAGGTVVHKGMPDKSGWGHVSQYLLVYVHFNVILDDSTINVIFMLRL